MTRRTLDPAVALTGRWATTRDAAQAWDVLPKRARIELLALERAGAVIRRRRPGDRANLWRLSCACERAPQAAPKSEPMATAPVAPGRENQRPALTELVYEVLLAHGPASANRIQRLVRRGRAGVLEAVRDLEAQGRVRRSADGLEAVDGCHINQKGDDHHGSHRIDGVDRGRRDAAGARGADRA